MTKSADRNEKDFREKHLLGECESVGISENESGNESE